MVGQLAIWPKKDSYDKFATLSSYVTEIKTYLNTKWWFLPSEFYLGPISLRTTCLLMRSHQLYQAGPVLMFADDTKVFRVIRNRENFLLLLLISKTQQG